VGGDGNGGSDGTHDVKKKVVATNIALKVKAGWLLLRSVLVATGAVLSRLVRSFVRRPSHPSVLYWTQGAPRGRR